MFQNYIRDCDGGRVVGCLPAAAASLGPSPDLPDTGLGRVQPGSRPRSLHSGSALRQACFCYALLCSLPASAYILLVTSLRYHLFIWSVFSPKLLYEGAHLLLTGAVCLSLLASGRGRAKS